MPRRTKPRAAGRSTVRIIGGKFRGRKLRFPEARGLRPTLGRTRETLFNWLVPHLPGTRCLDLFAGSGALGIEALSRGAASVLFVEQDSRACEALTENLAQFGLDEPHARVQPGNGLRILQTLGARQERFDLIFLDPPFNTPLLQQCLDLLSAGEYLNDGGLVYYEHADAALLVSAPFVSWREKKAGETRYGLLTLS